MKKLVALTIFLTLILTSCNFLQGDGGATATPTVAPADALRTSAAKTVDALSTSLASNKTATPPAATATGQPATATLARTSTLAVQTVMPSFTPVPSATPLPPTITQTKAPCDKAAFVKDVTVPDKTYFYPNTPFTKTWEIKNVGSCTWNYTYSLVFMDGEAMKATVSKQLVPTGIAVAPGQSVQLSMDMTAPGSEGEFRGRWRIKNPNGELFGVGTNGVDPFWVTIKVAKKFTLVDNLCSAEWRNGTDVLPCPGKVGDKAGTVLKVDAPKFITGYVEDEPGILMIPQAINDGLIVGKFPPMLIPTDPIFQSLVVCASDSPKCEAKVLLTYQIGTDAETVLLDLNKTASNGISPVSVNLDTAGLEGKLVVFRLYVKASGVPTDDRIYWINPYLKVP